MHTPQEKMTSTPNQLSHILGQPHVFVSNYKEQKIDDWLEFSFDCFEPVKDKVRPWRNLAEGRLFYIPNYLSGSDYSGSSVEASNLRVWKDQFKKEQGISWWLLYGGYGSYGIAVEIEKATDEIKETLEALENYPCISDDELSQLENERENEAWSDYLAGDFTHELKKKFCNTGDVELDEQNDEKIDNLSDDELFELFRNGMEASSIYYQHETGGSVYVDLESVVESITSLNVPGENQTSLDLEGS